MEWDYKCGIYCKRISGNFFVAEVVFSQKKFFILLKYFAILNGVFVKRLSPMNIKPPLLPGGGTIGIIAPSSPAKRKALERGKEYLLSRGYRIKTSPYLTRGKHYLAGPDDITRVKYLEEFLLDNEVDCIICARGGYGALRIVDKIDYGRLRKASPKAFVGYSDITVIQLAFLKKLGWITYSGPMVASDMGADFDPYSEKWLWKVLSEDPYPLVLENPEGVELKVMKHGEAEGVLIPVCFSLMTSLLGTEYMPSLKGAILVIEDIDEKSYRLDKLFQILKLHGVYDKIGGLILGQFTRCFNKRSFELEELLEEVLRKYDFPVISNLAYGHVKKRLTLPVGMKVSIQTAPLKITLLGK